LKPAQRLPLAIAALALALAALALGSVALVWLTLDTAERDALAGVLVSRAMLVVMLWLAVFGFAAWGLNWLHARYVEAPARLHEQAQALLAAGAGELAAQGSAANRGLARTIDALVRQRTQLQDDVARQVAVASRGIEQERSRLSALMAELTQSVLVCNLDGRILLYNQRARAQFRAWSRNAATAGGAELIGLGRSVYAVFDRALIAHALETIQQRARAGVAQPSAQFVTTAPGGQLLRVQMAPVADAPRADAAPGEPPAPGGFVLMLDDITREVEQAALRDRLLLGLTEGSRASLANLRAALEMLELPDLEPPMRERFQQVVRDEVAAMSTRVQSLAADVLAGIKTRWPMEDMLGADLVAAARSRIEALGAVRVDVNEVDPTLWLHVDSYTLLQALDYLARRLVDEYELRALRLRLGRDGPRARLDLVWAGQAMSTETVMSWQMEPMRSAGADATPLTVGDVVERHRGEFWFERERVRHEAFFRFLLPCAQAREPAPAAPAAPADGRPEFYDFDLFQTTAQTRELDERLLAELTYTVFDTETTGLAPSEGDEIIQIGATRIVNGRLLRHECIDQLIDPRRPLVAASAAIHGIRPEQLAGQPTVLEVLPVFHAFAHDTVLVAHNAAFDMRFLQLKEAASGLRFDQPVLDTMLLSAWLHPNQDSHRLEAIAERLGVAVQGRHTALGDAIVTAEVFLRLVALLRDRGIHTLGQARAVALQTYQARLRY
jgi:DNA polymerase III subunit epsilon